MGRARAKLAPGLLRTIAVAALGVALICYLVTHIGLRQVLTPAASIGWSGFALLCLTALITLVMLGTAWGVLRPASSDARMLVFVWARMVRDAASDVLPFSQIGGMALGLRATTLHGMPLRYALASMMVDLATEFLAQIVYVAFGVLIIWTGLPHISLTRGVVLGACVWVLCASLADGIFLALQRHGHHWLAGKFMGGLISGSSAYLGGVASALDEIYRSPARVACSIGIHLLACLANAAFTWLAFSLIGASVKPSSVAAMEALVYAARSVAFFVPSALGVQEAAYTAFAQLFGVGGELALAVSLLRRARDLATGVPVLLIWKAIEGKRALAAKDAASR